MRAIYKPELQVLSIGDTLNIEDESFHHLKVARIQMGEKLLLLKGNGQLYKVVVTNISKKDLSIEVLSLVKKERKYDLRLYVGLTKKDAFEEIIKFSVELGISQITPLLTDFSQKEIGQFKRAQKVLSVAMEQSNNPFAPSLNPLVSLKDCFERSSESQERFISFTSNKGQPDLSSSAEVKIAHQASFLIGPEGGFSSQEEEWIRTMSDFKIYLPTPILRAPTAVCVASGFLLKSLS